MNIKTRKNNNNFPMIFFTLSVWHQISAIVNKCALEVGWMGAVKREGNHYTIHHIWVPEQEVTSVTTEMTDEGMAKVGFECHKMFGDIQAMRYWGHSHVNMAVNPSGTDDKQMEEFMDNGAEFYIRSIHNKKGEVRLDLYDNQQGLEYHNLTPHILYPADMAEALESVKKQCDEQVKKPAPVVYSNQAWHQRNTTVRPPAKTTLANAATSAEDADVDTDTDVDLDDDHFSLAETRKNLEGAFQIALETGYADFYPDFEEYAAEVLDAANLGFYENAFSDWVIGTRSGTDKVLTTEEDECLAYLEDLITTLENGGLSNHYQNDVYKIRAILRSFLAEASTSNTVATVQ